MLKFLIMMACSLGLILGCDIKIWETLKDKTYQESDEKYTLLTLKDSQENCEVICENIQECKTFRYLDGKCVLSTQDHTKLKDEVGSNVVVQKCFSFDLVKLKEDVMGIGDIANFGLKKEAMLQNLANVERTRILFERNQETLKSNPWRKIQIKNEHKLMIESRTLIILAIIFMVVVAISNVTAVFHEKYQKCQKMLFGLFTGFICASLLAVFITFGQVDRGPRAQFQEITVKPLALRTISEPQIKAQEVPRDIKLFDTQLIGKDQWFWIKYADINRGDSNKVWTDRIEGAIMRLKDKPYVSNIAYHWNSAHKKFYTKPVNKGGTWVDRNKHPQPLFLYGKNLGFKRDGKTLFMLQNVDFYGEKANGKQFQTGKVENCGEAHSIIMQIGNQPMDSAYYYDPISKSLVEKPPKKKQGKWRDGKGCLFIWADVVIKEWAEALDHINYPFLPEGYCPSKFDINNFDDQKFQMVKDGKIDIKDGVFTFQNARLQFKGDCLNYLPDYNFKIEFKFKTRMGDCPLFSYDNDDKTGHDRHFLLWRGKPHQRVWRGGSWGVKNTPNLNDDKWHTWTLRVKSGEGQTMFIDGKRVGANSHDHSDFNWKTKFWLGFSNDAGNTKRFTGQIKDLIIAQIE